MEEKIIIYNRYKDEEALKSLVYRLNNMDIIDEAQINDDYIDFKYNRICNTYRIDVLIACDITNNKITYVMNRQKDKFIIHTEAYTENDFIELIEKSYYDILEGR